MEYKFTTYDSSTTVFYLSFYGNFVGLVYAHKGSRGTLYELL